jgi:hypothetical protein
MVVLRHLAVLGVVLALCTECGGRHACPRVCPFETAVFHLSCGSAGLTRVGLSGACSAGDSGSSSYLADPGSTLVDVSSSRPGQCHVVLAFATGFTYAGDVTFASRIDKPDPDCPGCSYTVPTPSTFTVNDLNVACPDAGH